MNGFNLSDITDAKFGNVQVSELYFGSTKIWPSITNECFYVETTHNTGGYEDYLTLSLLCNSYDERTGYGDPQTLYYSYDQIHWNIVDDYVYPPTGESGSRIIGQHSGVVCYYYVKNKIIPYNNNDKIYLKGNLSPHVTSTTSQDVTVQFDTGVIINLNSSYLVNAQHGSFLNNNFNIGGNICSLLYGNANHNIIPNNYTYVFSKLIHEYGVALIDASNLILPNNVTENCYYEMFFGSQLLTAAPALPATTLAPYCYNHMFGDCPSLTTAPELPATTLAIGCYYQMFAYCTSLNYVKCLATDMTATDCTTLWLENVSSTGTFVKDANTYWDSGTSGIPVGWTVQNEGHDYSQEYLTFEALESGNFTWTGTNNSNSIYYSIDDGSTWTQLTSGSTTPTLNANDKILFKASGLSVNSGIGKFSSAARFNAMGNIMSLQDGDNFPNSTSISNNNQFQNLFKGCTGLVDASNLILPATTLTERCYSNMLQDCSSLTSAPALPATTLAPYCYYFMFIRCTSLTTAPALPATTLANNCYEYMFNGCSSLTSAPALPATTLAVYCYGEMFMRCTSLTTAPELPAATLANNCYSSMFSNCTSLNYVKCLATYVQGYGLHTYNWLQNVSASGTFVRYANTTWPSGANGIPSGWTIQNA